MVKQEVYLSKGKKNREYISLGLYSSLGEQVAKMATTLARGPNYPLDHAFCFSSRREKKRQLPGSWAIP
jgi:hypothetical protein